MGGGAQRVWLPSRVVMALFRGKWLAAIRRAVRQGQVQRPAGRLRSAGTTC